MTSQTWPYKRIENDDAFFNRNWAGARGGRWAGPGLLAGWDAGFWIVGVEVGSLLCRRTGVRLLLH